MSTAEQVPNFEDLYLGGDDQSLRDEEARYKQAVRIGFVEMERIVEEVIVPEFEKVGEILYDAGYALELVVFDTDSHVSEDLFVCGAGLHVRVAGVDRAIVYTGDPYRFEFTLQTLDCTGNVEERNVEYHKLNPYWFYKSILDFLDLTFPDVDFSKYVELEEDQWQLMEGPFTVKLKPDDGDEQVIAQSATIEEAMQMASRFCAGFTTEEMLILEDSQGRQIC
ncbi:hypothetical protein [Rubritalea marina]|uniref:hypothetical protein n=1 Tax=Rubritalea marina TaxID=361055 RepID=UPI0003A9CA3B|nr:hypothetical protein [Rubritalea marina]